jgi:hypothetical protein
MESIFTLSSNANALNTPSCPKCGNEMDRINRSAADRIFVKLTMGMIQVKRFLCLGCLWETRTMKRKISRSNYHAKQAFPSAHASNSI